MAANSKIRPPKVTFKYFLELVNNTFGALSKLAGSYPHIMLGGVPFNRVYLINHPNIIQQILQKNYKNYPKSDRYDVLALLLGNGLVTNGGDSWHKQRTMIQPAFHRETLKRIHDITVDSTSELITAWKAKEGGEINFTREMAGLTIDIVAKSLFTTDITNDNIQTVWHSINYLNEAADRMIRGLIRIPASVPIPRHVKMKKYIAELDAIIYGIIDRRKQEKNPPHDLLQLLLEARYEDGTGMNDKQIRDEVMTIFVAGHETTVNALSWTWFLLKQHLTEEKKLKEESIRFENTNPSFEDIMQLAVGRNVMNESMRLYPPVPVVGRIPVQPDEAMGYHIPPPMCK